MKKKRGVRTALLCVFLAGVLIGLSSLGWVLYNEVRAGDPLQKSDVIIVLGARVKPDGSLSNSLEYRLQTALQVYEQGYASSFIVCGAQGSDEPTTEAEAMRNYLVAQGVPQESIFMDDQSINTRENLQNAYAIMQENGMSSAIVVTNAYHVARAKSLCREIGIDALGAAAQMPRGFFIPWKMRVRESISWIIYLLRKVVPFL